MSVAVADNQATADQEMSQREPGLEKILKRAKQAQKKMSVASPMVVHNRQPRSMRT